MPALTQRFRENLQKLRWRLTLSYTAVTVGALLVVELVVIVAILAYLAANPSLTPRELLDGVRHDLVPLIRPYLAHSPPDVAGLTLFLRPLHGGVQESEIKSSFGSVQFALARRVNLEAYIIGVDGALLGTFPYDPVASRNIGRPFATSTLAGVEGPLKSALAGLQDYRDLYTLQTPGNEMVGAVPVVSDGKVVAAVAFSTAPLPWGTWALSEFVQPVGYSLVLFTLVAGAIGTVFGSLTAGNLAKRLNRLSDAAHAWSRGRFTFIVSDPTGDELAQLTDDLNSMAQQLEVLLNRRQEMSAVEERNRLARDLHDSAKQQAFAASAHLGAARAMWGQDPEGANIHLSEAETLVDEVRQELTHLIEELRPVALQGTGLAPVLREYVSEWSSQNDIKVGLRIKGERALPLDVEQSLFRIAQEALTNVARHSGASRAEVLLAFQQNSVSLTISDDGHGFASAGNQLGLGIHAMRERTGLLHGELDISSLPGRGTRISATCPAPRPT